MNRVVAILTLMTTEVVQTNITVDTFAMQATVIRKLTMILRRKPNQLRALVVTTVWVTMLIGCRSATNQPLFEGLPKTSLSDISYDAVEDERGKRHPNVNREPHRHEFSLPPLTSADKLPPLMNVSVDDVVYIALANSKILRSLNAQVLNNPAATNGVFGPAIQATDPLFGIEAALSQFDANLSASLIHQNNDDVFNNSILGGGATEIVQDLTTANFTLDKVGATGTRYTVQGNLQYDSNDNPASIFPSSYRGFWEATASHPLLQGSGTDFNRIAGPNAAVGLRNTNGVLISRVNNDISIAQFEQGVRQFVNDSVNAYWELYFAYRNFESAKNARDGALETWNTVKARFDNDLTGGEAHQESQAREQFFLFQQQLVAALNGDFRAGVSGVLQAEADLRRLIGLPQNDGRLICPSDSPASVGTVYDWNTMLDFALEQRVEIRQQLWQVRRRELELLASKNFLLPRLDAFATFRNTGFGDDIIGGGGRFSSVVSDKLSGDHNEWELGLNFNVPIGFRQASSGVRNAELQLYRERYILREQEQQVIHDLGSAIRETRQYQAAVHFAFNRFDAASDTVNSRQAAFDADAVPLDSLLESQRRLVDAQTAYHRAQVNLQLASESVQLESGRLLARHSIQLNQAQSENLARVSIGQRQSKVNSTLQHIDYRAN